MARGEPIEFYHIDKPSVIITNDLRFEEHTARIAFGISLDQYESLPGNPEWITEQTPYGLSKAHVIAWNRLNNRISAVQIQAAKKT